MAAKIVIEPMERSLPTSIAYGGFRLASFRLEDDVPAEWEKSGRPGTSNDEWRAERLREHLKKVRADQLQDLDDQEAVLRARYDIEVALKPGERAARIAAAREAQGMPPVEDLPGFTTADKVQPPARTMPVPPIADAPPAGTVAARVMPPRTTPPPAAMRDVSDGTADELRRLGARVAALGMPYDGELPSSEAEAQQLIPVLRARIFDLEKGRAQPAQPAPAAPAKAPPALPMVKPDGTPFRDGATMMAGDRKCSHEQHGVRNPQPIPTLDWNTSNRHFGRPLCQAHMAEARRAAATKLGVKA